MENTIAPHAKQNISVVAFRLSQRTFALPLEVIMQILPMMTITPIPHLSHIVKGTVNIRGEDVLAISLRSHFDMEEVDWQLYTPLLLLKLKDRSLALIVDAVLDVMHIPLEILTDLQDILPDGIENVPMLKGISHYKDDTILVLDPGHLFYNHHQAIAQLAELKAETEAETEAEPVVAEIPPAPVAEAPALKKKSPARKLPAENVTAPATPSQPTAENKEENKEEHK
jgi:purine-binding chemotaxis protein CheW